jgi:hypothetical protein
MFGHIIKYMKPILDPENACRTLHCMNEMVFEIITTTQVEGVTCGQRIQRRSLSKNILN